MPELNLRQAARGLMIDPAERILLVKLETPFNGWTGWVLPGGGLEEGESLHEGLRRELAEETGIPQLNIGPEVMHRTHTGPAVTNSQYHGQKEYIFLVRCKEFEPKPVFTSEELRAEGVVCIRWWTLPDIECSDETIIPENLPELVRQILVAGAPGTPITLEIHE